MKPLPRLPFSGAVDGDGHVLEPPDLWVRYLEPAFRDRAPGIRTDDQGLEYLEIDGRSSKIVRGGMPAGLGMMDRLAGYVYEREAKTGLKYVDDAPLGAMDSKERIERLEMENVARVFLYPTLSIFFIAECDDEDLTQAYLRAYNRWIVDFCNHDTKRLVPIAHICLKDPEGAVEEVKRARKDGCAGVYLSPDPPARDGRQFDDPVYDEFWEAAIDLGLPLSFHILTSSSDSFQTRGPRMNGFLSIVRGCQDIMGMLVLGGVFERHPKLKIVCVEADAGWVPHYMYRMDHAFKRHHNWLPAGQDLSKLPSEYFAENIYTTFQDDWVAFKVVDLMNWRRLMWANDFPHSDSTWPWSQEMLKEHTQHLSAEQKQAILCGNVAELYGIDLALLHGQGLVS